MISSIRCDRRRAQAVPLPSSFSSRSARRFPPAMRLLSAESTSERTAVAEPSPEVAVVSEVSSWRSAVLSTSSSSFRTIFVIE